MAEPSRRAMAGSLALQTPSLRGSPSPQRSPRSEETRGQTYTRGEKCLYMHITVTFSLILAFILIYGWHLLEVPHNFKTAIQISRMRAWEREEQSFKPVGALYLKILPPRVMCSTLLLRARWSLAPAHCVDARSNPDLLDYYKAWRISYCFKDNVIESPVKRSVPHPLHSRTDFSNNVGLIQHEWEIDLYNYTFHPFPLKDEDLDEFNMSLYSWSSETLPNPGHCFTQYPVLPVPQKKCVDHMAPVVDIRPYERCMLPGRKSFTIPSHGSIFVVEDKVVGIFSWGERAAKGTPFIIVHIEPFRPWIETLIAL